MRVLFIGGTGIISSASSPLAIESGIELYTSAVGGFSWASDYEDATTLNLMYNYRLAALHSLCSIYPDHADNLDGALITALQLHLVLDLGGLLSTTLNTLCDRLYATLRFSLDSGLPTYPMFGREKCEAWLLLTGLMASRARLDLQQWFSNEACLRIRKMQAWSKVELQSICDPFRLGLEVLSPVFFEAAVKLGREGR